MIDIGALGSKIERYQVKASSDCSAKFKYVATNATKLSALISQFSNWDMENLQHLTPDLQVLPSLSYLHFHTNAIAFEPR